MLRIYLSGRMSLEMDGTVVGAKSFPGQQGRNALAFLVLSRPGPVSRDALADALWSGRPPTSWESSLSALVSKLRRLFGRLGLDGSDVLVGGGGTLEVRLPAGTWVDHDAALDAIHQAEAALQAGDPAEAYGPSAVAHHIARRPFLPGESAPWIDRRRERLDAVLVRALECRARVYLWNGEIPLAVEAGREVVRLRPFRESGYRLLMEGHAAAGNAAEALRVYEDCRRLISEELGVGPSEETRALHARVLGTV